MDDLNDPSNQPARWRTMGARGAKWRMPMPPGPPPPPSKAEREQEQRDQERGAARVDRLHLIGLFSGGVVVMGIALAVVIILAALALTSHH